MNVKKIMCLGLIFILTIGFIFFNSSQSVSDSNLRSYAISQRLIAITEGNKELNYKVHNIITKLAEVEKLNEENSKDHAGVLNLFIRKCAHAFEFFLLSLILCFAFDAIKLKLLNTIIYSLFITLIGANCDEFFQMFSVGRTSSVVDVLIDFFGAVIACITFLIVKFAFNNVVSINKVKK